MPRPLTSGLMAAIQANVVRPALFVEGHFVSGIVYMWTGIGNITWNGHTWIGVGSLGGITPIEEGGNVEAKGITLSLSGIDQSLLADALQELQQGLPVLVYLGTFDNASPPNLIADPFTAWAGRMDQPTIDVAGDSATISINCENRLIDMDVAVDRRYTIDDQQMDFPGDLGFQWVNALQSRMLIWGRLPVSANNL